MTKRRAPERDEATAQDATLELEATSVDARLSNAEEARAASEARYRTLFEYLPDGILIADTQSYYLDANASICSMLGYSRDELIGKHAADIVSPAEVEHIEPALEEIQATADYSRQWTFRRKDGSTFPAEVIVTVMPDGNLLAVIRDVTDRVAAERALRDREAQLRLASRVAKLGAWSVELPSGVIRWSDELCEIKEVPLGTTPTRDDALSFYAPEFREHMSQVAQVCLQNDKPFETQAQIMTLKGRRKWVRVLGQAERNARGEMIRLHGTLQDIDDQHRLEDQLRQAQKMEAIGQLAGGVAHDFNNLLSVVLSYAELVQRQLDPGSTVYADVEEIRRAGERATALTRQLLAFGRRQVLQPRVLDVGEVMQGMESMLRRLLGETVELMLSVQSGLGSVLVDPTQVEQIVLNLAVNARDAMPHGGKLHIEASNADLHASYTHLHHDLDAGPYVLLAISDSGTGMDRETREHIFEPFFTTKEQGKGTGLGLSTVFGIVKQSRGHIAVYSELGRGTTFKVYLPRTDAKPELIAAPSVAPSMRGTETIMLVEDEPQVRAVTTAILERHGYQVLVARDGVDALGVMDEHPGSIDLLITDVVMPRMNGADLAERLKRSRPSTEVLFVSGYTEGAIVGQGVLDKGVAFLQKPITPDALCRKIRAVLDAARNEPALMH